MTAPVAKSNELARDSLFVLYIEDNPTNAFVMEMILAQAMGLKMITAGDVPTALRIAAQQRPALIFTDIHLPGIDGVAGTKLLRAIDDLQDVPIVAVSADSSPLTRRLATEAGCDAYVTKPINIAELKNVVQQCLGPLVP